MAAPQHKQPGASLLGSHQTVSFIHHKAKAATFAPAVKHINQLDRSTKHSECVRVMYRKLYLKDYSAARPVTLASLDDWGHVG